MEATQPRRSTRLSKNTASTSTNTTNVVDTSTGTSVHNNTTTSEPDFESFQDFNNAIFRIDMPKYRITPRRSSLRIAKRFKSKYGSVDTTNNDNNNNKKKKKKKNDDDDDDENEASQVSLRYSSTGSRTSFPLFDDHIMQHILSYVGEFQYRFIGGVNRSFHTSYITLYPQKETHCHASSIERTKYCWDDIAACTNPDEDSMDEHRRILWYSAIRYGKKYVIMYLVELLPPPNHIAEFQYGDVSIRVDWKNDWKFDLCCMAAQYGQFELLKWVCAEDIYVVKEDERVIHNAFTSGHREIYSWAFQNGFWMGEHTFIASRFRIVT